MVRPVLAVHNVEKAFGDRAVLQDVSFRIEEGEIFCLLGPNGAGKTTTMNVLSTALRPDGGEVVFRGTPVTANSRAYRQALGIVPQNVAIYEDVSAKTNVTFFASLYGLRGRVLHDCVREALHFVGLYDRRDDKPKTFSGGMKRRLNIACAIAHQPDVIMMDEPTVGIDPQSRTYILERIRSLSRAGTTVIYTTHYMEEVEAIADRIAIMDHGKLIAEGTNDQLKGRLGGGRVYTIELDDAGRVGALEDGFAVMLKAMEGLEGVDTVERNKDRRGVFRVTTTAGAENLDRIVALVMQAGYSIRNVTTTAVSLEAVFLQLTGRTLRN